MFAAGGTAAPPAALSQLEAEINALRLLDVGPGTGRMSQTSADWSSETRDSNPRGAHESLDLTYETHLGRHLYGETRVCIYIYRNTLHGYIFIHYIYIYKYI